MKSNELRRISPIESSHRMTNLNQNNKRRGSAKSFEEILKKELAKGDKHGIDFVV